LNWLILRFTDSLMLLFFKPSMSSSSFISIHLMFQRHSGS
jgi:hypothetical protein